MSAKYLLGALALAALGACKAIDSTALSSLAAPSVSHQTRICGEDTPVCNPQDAPHGPPAAACKQIVESGAASSMPEETYAEICGGMKPK